MTTAAIYARKSTAQNGVADEARSVARQIEHAKAYAERKGWTVSPAYVYSDDGVSGAEFERRPGFIRLMNSLKPRAPFGVLILSDVDRLGRDSVQTPYVIYQLLEAGVRIFTYGNQQEVEMTGALDTFQMQTLALVGALEREKARQRTYDAMRRKAEHGHHTGGRVFGYTGRTINPVEAAVVRRIFALYDSGLGLKALAKRLTAEGAPAPKPFVRRDPTKVLPVRGWSPTTIRAILQRELYRGVIVWNRSRKRNARGQVKQRPRPKSEWMRIPAEQLRIVSDDVWMRAATRRQETEGRQLRFSDGRMTGRPPKQVTQNLLSGLATCAVCGGGLCVETAPRKRGRVPEYICSRRRVNGTCSNALRLPVSEVNEAVLHAIEEHALTPEAVEAVIRLTERDDYRERQERLALEMADVARKISRLVDAIADGADAASLKTRLRALEARQTELRTEAAALRPVPHPPRLVVENRLAEWRRLLRQRRRSLQRLRRRDRPLPGRVERRHRPSNEVQCDVSGLRRHRRLFVRCGARESIKADAERLQALRGGWDDRKRRRRASNFGTRLRD